MNNLDQEHHRQLQVFSTFLEEQNLWMPGINQARTDEAGLLVTHQSDESPEAIYELRARRYHNGANLALKVNVWGTTSPTHSYLGAIGYHSLDAAPYSKLARPSLYDEARLYSILGATSIR